MRSYWHAIKRLPGFKGSLLRLHLLTGGQRIEQLVNLQTADIASCGKSDLNAQLLARNQAPTRFQRIALAPALAHGRPAHRATGEPSNRGYRQLWQVKAREEGRLRIDGRLAKTGTPVLP